MKDSGAPGGTQIPVPPPQRYDVPLKNRSQQIMSKHDLQKTELTLNIQNKPKLED
jgi:hypothetical protein